MTIKQVRDNFIQNLAENAYINMCTTEEMQTVISALEKQIPKKPNYPNKLQMTDKEIIKALECCNRTISQNSCEGCSYHHSRGRCTENLLKDTIYLINRQKAEIERLQNEN